MACRYYILKKYCRLYSDDKEFKESSKTIPDNHGLPIYLDILEKHELTYHVEMTFHNGEVITGYIINRPYIAGRIPTRIGNLKFDQLYDGRFNSKLRNHHHDTNYH